ncbi:helix-turn-helix domain-containing protein [Methyloprofundus sp.]|uniref:helix-turn-helix domain-containing protein n=1 Tax=Methyloprofundus sp. TaxID=2020875 RepID=UPI003D11476F
MNNNFEIIASSARFVRLQRNIDQESAANETGVSLRTIQNIEAGKAVNSSSLFAYLNYLDLLDNMLATLPDPAKLTPMEQLKATPTRRARARGAVKNTAITSLSNNSSNKTGKNKQGFQWGDEK